MYRTLVYATTRFFCRKLPKESLMALTAQWSNDGEYVHLFLRTNPDNLNSARIRITVTREQLRTLANTF